MIVLYYLLILVYSGMFYLIVGINYWLILLIVLTPIMAALSLILFSVLITPLWSFLSPKNRFKNLYISSLLKLGLMLIGVRYRVSGKENLLTENYIVVGNHKSWCDIMLIYIIAKTPIGFVAKPGVYKVPIIAQYMRSIGCVVMHRDDDREGARDMIKAIRQVKEGLPMCIFPEGGIRSRVDEHMLETRDGAFKLAIKSRASIIPFTLNGMTKIKNNAPFRRTNVNVFIHSPITYEQYSSLNSHEIGEMVKNTINSRIQQCPSK